MRWFQISLIILLFALVGCGRAPVASSPAGAPATREPGPSATLPASEPPSEMTPEIPDLTTTSEPAPVNTSPSPAPTEPAVDEQSTSAVWVQNGSRLIPVVIDKPRVIDLAEGGEAVSPGGVVISPDGSRFAYSINAPGRLGMAIFDLDSGQSSFINGASFGARFAPDGHSVVYTLADQTSSRLVARNLETGEERTLIESTAMDVPQAIDWLATGIVVQRLLVPSDAPPRGLSLVDPQSGESRAIHEGGYLHADLTRDGDRAAVVPGTWSMGGIGEAGLTVVDVQTAAERVIIPQMQGEIPVLSWSPDGARLAYSSITEWEAPARTLHLLAGDDYAGHTVDLGALGMLQDVDWRDSETLLLLMSDPSGTLRLYEFAASATDAAAASEIGAYDAAPRGQTAQILVARR